MRVPTFAYNDGEAVDLALMLPVGLWNHRLKQTGGDIESDAAFPASFIVRRDYQLAIPLRFYESEWPEVRALIEYAQTGGVFTWFPDLESEDSFDVYFDAPKIGEDIDPQTDGSYPRAMSLTIVVRRVDGEPWDLGYFMEAA